MALETTQTENGNIAFFNAFTQVGGVYPDILAVERVHHRWDINYSSPQRTVSASDSNTFANPITGGILTDALSVEDDKQILDLSVAFPSVGTTDAVTVTPIGINGSDVAVRIFRPFTFRGFDPGASSSPIRLTASDEIISVPWQWRITGVVKVGFHVFLTGATSAKIFAQMISGNHNHGVSVTWPSVGAWTGISGG